MILIKHCHLRAKHFFLLYPASGYALCGIIFSFIPPLIACIFLPLVFIKKTRAFVLFGYVFTLHTLILPHKLPHENLTVQGRFYPQKTIAFPSYIKTYEGIEGVLKTKDKTYQIVLFDKSDHITSPCELTCEIKKGDDFPKIVLKNFKPSSSSYSLFLLRKKISHLLFNHFFSKNHEESSKLLYALLTGALDHKLLKVKFSTFGLAHILALSGFHLNLLSGFCVLLLKPFIGHQKAKFCSMLILLFYFVYVGPICSITRAFTMAFLGYIHSFFSLTTKPLHTFSLSLIATTFICQHQLSSPSFALSFLATLALICSNHLWQKMILLIPSASNYWEKFIYQWLKLFYLQLFVFLFTLPACLYYFHKALSISLFYNLFFPTLVSIFMILSCFFGLIKACYCSLGHLLLEKNYLCFDYILKCLESPHLSQGFVISYPFSTFLFIATLVCQIYLIFHAFKKNRMI